MMDHEIKAIAAEMFRRDRSTSEVASVLGVTVKRAWKLKQKTKRGPGRPIIGDKAAEESVTFRLSPTLKAALMREAAVAGVSASELVRRVVTKSMKRRVWKRKGIDRTNPQSE